MKNLIQFEDIHTSGKYIADALTRKEAATC